MIWQGRLECWAQSGHCYSPCSLRVPQQSSLVSYIAAPASKKPREYLPGLKAKYRIVITPVLPYFISKNQSQAMNNVEEKVSLYKEHQTIHVHFTYHNTCFISFIINNRKLLTNLITWAWILSFFCHHEIILCIVTICTLNAG